MQIKVLLVAPRTDLLFADEEVQDIIRSGLLVTPMLGKVTSTELLREIKASQYDVLWLACHGEKRTNNFNPAEYGVQLSDGFMPASELVAQVRGRFSLVYLNSCTSWQIAQQIQEDANVAVIGTILDVPDRQAYQTGSLFASALADNLAPYKAYKRSKPGGERIYMFLAALEPTQDSIDGLMLEVRELKVQIEREVVWLRRLLWSSLVLHGVEGIAIVWLWLRLMGA
jgi:hypothetical protein